MERILGYPIAEYLGLDVSSGRTRIMCRSPFNPSERTASFAVDTRKNLFHCFSTERKGGILELVMQLEGLRSHGEAVDFIGKNILHLTPVEDDRRTYTRRWSPPKEAPAARAPEPSAVRIREVGDITDSSLLSYIESRCVRRDIVARYCRQVRYSTESRPDGDFVSLGFRNNKQDTEGNPCYALRNGTKYKISTGQAETTIGTHGEFTLEPTSDTVAVFEGFYDFLSYLEYRGSAEPGVDVVVLNSVGNLSTTGEGKYANEYIRRHARINVFLDNDEAGRRTAEVIRRLYSPRSLVVDMSCLYAEGAKDLNDFLRNDPTREKGIPLAGHI